MALTTLNFWENISPHFANTNIMPQPGWIPWATCAARPIMLQGLEPGGYLFENKSISFQEAYQHYSAMPEFANVVFSQFKARLTSYRKLAPDRGSWIKWNVKCGARQMILDDLQPGGGPL
jgi:hypothetical protein